MRSEDSRNPLSLVFVTHDYSPYGAATSLNALLSNLNSNNCRLIVQKPLFKRTSQLDFVSRRFNFPRDRISFCALPLSDNFERAKESLKHRIYRMLINLRWLVKAGQTHRHINSFSPDVVHLNSLTLLPMLTNKYNCIIHIRERCLANLKKKIGSKIKNAAGVIFIDSTTRDALPLATDMPSIMLTNPVSLGRAIEKWNRTEALHYFRIEKNIQHVFAVIGKIDNDDKGVPFIIEAFSSLANNDIVLLVIGAATNNNEMKRVEDLAKKDHRIKICGEIFDQGLIYSAVDTVIRGEVRFCHGRTTLEALFSGGRVIIPATDHEILSDITLSAFTSRIFGYNPRSHHSLADALRTSVMSGTSKFSLIDNSEQYSQEFIKFVCGCANLKTAFSATDKTKAII